MLLFAHERKVAKMKENKSVQLNVSVPASVYDRLVKEAEAIGLTRSAYVAMALSQKWQSETVVSQLPQLINAFNNMSTAITKASGKTGKGKRS